MKNISSVGFLICLLISAGSCKKDSGGGSPPPVETTKMIVKVNGVADTLELFQANYYRQWKQVYLAAVDGDKGLNVAINLKPGLIGNYSFAPNGDNCVIWANGPKYYFTELDVTDAGGTLAITQLDTVGLAIKGVLHASAYSPDLKEKITIDAAIPDSVTLNPADLPYNGNWSSMMIQGATGFSWYARDLFIDSSCSGSAAAGLLVRISSMYGFGFNSRHAAIRIPMSLMPGEYPVYPDQAPYSNCSNLNVTSYYSMGSFNGRYQATGGTFKLISINPAQKKLEAEFNIDYQDPDDAAHVLHLSNGKLHLETFSSH